MTVEEQAAADAAAKSEAADKALEERISKTVNAALSSHMKRQKPGLDAEGLEKFMADREAAQAEAAATKAKGGDSEVAKLHKLLEKQGKDFAEMRATAEKATAAKRDTDGRMSLSMELEKGGITGARLKHALNHLRAEGQVKFVDDKLVFAKGDEDVELAEGVAEWLKSEDGKYFLPPSNAGGSGSGQGGKGFTARPGDKSGDSKARASVSLANHMGRGGQ